MVNKKPSIELEFVKNDFQPKSLKRWVLLIYTLIFMYFNVKV